MTAGKCAAQSGHAFLDAFLLAQQIDPSRCLAYRAHRHGTKIVLAGSYEAILRAHRNAGRMGVPSVLVIDEGCPNFFDGKPILTALGMGPLTRRESSRLLAQFPLFNQP